MIVKVNKDLILESLDQFLDDVDKASSHGVPGAPNITDSVNKFLDDVEKFKHSMTPTQIKEANLNSGDRLMDPKYNKGIK